MRCSTVEIEDGYHRFAAQFTVYDRALVVALVQKSYDTQKSSRKEAPKDLVSSLDIVGVLIKANPLNTTQETFAGSWSSGLNSCCSCKV